MPFPTQFSSKISTFIVLLLCGYFYLLTPNSLYFELVLGPKICALTTKERRETSAYL